MQKNNLASLLESLQNLYSSIEKAIEIIRTKTTNRNNTLERLTKYKEICEEQIALAERIEIENEELQDESIRNISLISGMAELIKADAKDALETKKTNYDSLNFV